MKKLIAYIISFIMIMTSSVVSASDSVKKAEDEERVILSSGFEEDFSAQNSSVLYIDSKGESVSVVEDGYMQIQKNTVKTDPYFDVDLSSVSDKSIVYCADFRKGEQSIVADLLKVRYTDNSMVSFLSMDANGNVYCANNLITKLDTVKLTNIAVFFEVDGSFEIYINKELKYSSNTGKNLGWQFLRCQVLPDNNCGIIDIDNLKIYTAESFLQDAETYILNKDFSEEGTFKDGFIRINAGTGNTILQKVNSSLQIITQDASKDPYMDVMIPDCDTFSSLVFSADFIFEEFGVRTKIFQARNSLKDYLTDVYITENGDVYQQSKKIASLSLNEPTEFAVIYDVTNSSYDVYINGEKKITGKNAYGGEVERVRIQILPGYGTGSFKIDNLKVYEGSELRKLSDYDSIAGWSVLPGDKADIIRLGEAVAYHTASDNAFYNGEKRTLSKRPFIKNGEMYIPGEIAFPITGKSESGDLCLAVLCEDYGKELICDRTGLIVITDGEFKYKEDRTVLNRLSTYLFSQRPDEDVIEDLFAKSQNAGVHPRILATQEDFDYFISQKDKSSPMADWLENIVFRADNILITTPCNYRLQEFRLNAVVGIVLERIMTLSFAYRLTGNEIYAKRALEEMENAIEYPDWNPQHFLDTAEMTFAMAIGYDWCYDYLTQENKTDKISEAIINMGLNEGERQYRGYATGTSFIFQDMNWNSVCNAGMCIGALAVMEEVPEYSYGIVKNALRSLEYMLPAFAPDGGWQEGPSYWNYAYSYLVRMVKCLEISLGTDFDIPNFTGIENSAMYAVAMQGNTGTNNYHDASESKKIATELLWAGDYFGKEEYTAYYLDSIKGRIQNDELFRCLYYDRKTDINTSFGFPKDNLFRNLEAVSMRDSYEDKNGTYLSFHAGNNSVNHRQYDAGTFVLDMMGERWATDLGTEPLSYSMVAGELLYRVRPEGHNTLVINPSAEIGQNKKTDCPVTKFVSKEKGAYATVDLTDAYSSQVDSAIRGYMLTDNRSSVIIRDEITLKEESDIYWFMHTAADITIVDENTAILSIGNKSVQLDANAEGGDAVLYKTAATQFDASYGASGQADNSTYQKVAIKVTGSGNVSISVRITPLNEEYAQRDFVPEEISLWNIEDGEMLLSSKSYEKEYIIHSELFDEDISSPQYIDSYWSIKNGSGKIGGMIQNSKTSITWKKGVGGKSDSDGCVVVKTENLTSATGLDPFVQIECETAQKDNVTFEFQFLAEGDQSLYVQLIDSNRNTKLLMEAQSDGIVYFSGNKVKAERGIWHDVAITFKCRKKTADIYIDGKLIAENIAAASDIKRLKLISLYPEPEDGVGRSGITAIDNIRVYRGEKEDYYYKCFAKGEETENPYEADEVFVNVSDESCRKVYYAEYSVGNKLTDIKVINPGEEFRKEFSGYAKLLNWSKYSLYPELTAITLGGDRNE